MTEATGTITTIYSGNYIYQNNALQMINQPEGYLEPNGQGGYDYGYRLKVGAQRACIPLVRGKSRLCENHLGNIRLTFVDFDHNGSIALSEITEENNYYPFGLKHKGYNNIVNSNTNAVASKFKYNGKELNDELGLDWYDYGARFYDPAIGRWHVIDPMADKFNQYSPYNYCLNNPIIYIDPDGKEIKVSSATNAKTGHTAVQFTMNIKVKNSSSLTANQVNILASSISKQIESSFQGFDNESNTSYSTKVNIEYDNNSSEGDFYMDIVDQVTSSDKPVSALGETEEIGNTQENKFQVLAPGKSPGDGYKDATFFGAVNTGAHEVGHGGGLRHQKTKDSKNKIDIGSDNLMYIYGDEGTKITIKQLIDLQKRVETQQKEKNETTD